MSAALLTAEPDDAITTWTKTPPSRRPSPPNRWFGCTGAYDGLLLARRRVAMTLSRSSCSTMSKFNAC